MIEIQTTTGEASPLRSSSGEEKPMINDALSPLLVLAIPVLLVLGLSILVFQLLMKTVRIYGEKG